MNNLLRIAGALSVTTCLWTGPAQAQSDPEAETEVDEVVVIGQKLATIPTDAMTATKSSLALIDTPATITVITRDLIDSQMAVNLQDVLRNASGVNQAGNNYGVGDFFQSRGLPDAVLPSRSVWDAGAEYIMDSGWMASLRVHNLTDELAYQRALFLGGQPIAPRSVAFTVRRSW